MTNYFKIETPFGNVYAHATAANHIFVDANHNCLSSHIEEGGDRHGPITVNRMSIGMHAHFYLSADGSFAVGKDGESPSQRYHSLYASNLNAKGNSYKSGDVSFASRDKIVAVLTPLVNAWVKANPDKLLAANVDDLESKLEKAEEDFREKRQEYRDAEMKMNKARTELNSAKAAK